MHHSEIARVWLVIYYTFFALYYGALIKKHLFDLRNSVSSCALKRNKAHKKSKLQQE